MLRKSRILSALAFSILFSLAIFSQAATFTAKVIGVVDGDTITDLDASGRQIQVRLAGIDAPEKTQDFGQASKQNLADLIFGKKVTLVGSKYDRYGRLIAKVLLGSRDINLEQVRAGFAWHYKQYEKEQSVEDREAYASAETAARAAGKGLWQSGSPVAPWDYRHHQEVEAVTVGTQPAPAPQRIIINAPSSMQSSNDGGGVVDVQGSSSKPVHVNGYQRKDGTIVGPYDRSAPTRRH